MSLVETHKLEPFGKKYEILPRRIFLDTNIVQYLNDYPDLVFEGFQEDILRTTKGKEILSGTHLHSQLSSLSTIFTPVTRIPYQFAVSENVFEEVKNKNDRSLENWFLELMSYWKSSIDSTSFVGWGKRKLARAQGDYALQAGLSKKDFRILCDALLLECDCILTCDRYRNRNEWIHDKYRIMVLYPTDLVEMIMPFRALWC